MSINNENNLDKTSLEVTLNRCDLPVSNLSSLLRVLQAALRDIARNTDNTREFFSESPYPVLRLLVEVSGENLILNFIFTLKKDSGFAQKLSEAVFEHLMMTFTDLIKGLPQRGLWGQSLASSRSHRLGSPVERRLHELQIELRRFTSSRLKYRSRSIRFEGDHMEIE